MKNWAVMTKKMFFQGYFHIKIGSEYEEGDEDEETEEDDTEDNGYDQRLVK